MNASRILTLSAVAALFAACGPSPNTTPAPAPSNNAAGGQASGGSTGGSTAGDTVVATEVLVNVINNRTPPAMVTVWVVGPSIGRTLLGNVQIGETKAFTFKAGNLNGNYKLIAQGQGGAELPSQTFNLTPTLRFVQWSLDVNSVIQYATPR
jgi:hypothetical protein